jgi:MATE family multidrug resistance protein
MGAEVAIFTLVGLLSGRLGAEQMAAHQIALSVSAMSFTIAVGIGTAGGVRVGREIGAAQQEGTRRAGFVAFACGAGFMSVTALLFVLFPRAIAGMLTSDGGVVQIVVPLFAVAAVFQISDGIQAVGSGVLRGAGDTAFAFVANLVGHWLIGFPTAMFVGFRLGLGVTGLWWGLCAGLTAVAFTLLVRFHVLSRGGIAALVKRE